jgi:N-acetylglucosamine-6-phosphate deacetylase
LPIRKPDLESESCKMLAISAETLYTPFETIHRPTVIVEEGIIRSLAGDVPLTAKAHNFPGAVLAPGLIDLHIHGGGGRDVMQADALPEIERFLTRYGVTSYLPTTVTAPVDQTLSALERMADSIENSKDGATTPLGIHLEGPFLSHARRGVHPAEFLQPPSRKLFDRLWEAARGQVKMMTIAPEVEGALELISEASSRGVCVSIGHSDSDMATARAAIDAGARHATHTFNAMRPLDHRAPGILAVVLTDHRLSADIIADGVHVDPTVVDLFLRTKSPESAVLISDALSPTGMPEGRYQLGSMEVEVRGNVCYHGQTLAGSVLTLDRAVRNIMHFAHSDLPTALRLATANPARQLGLLSDFGKGQSGKRTNSGSQLLARGALAVGNRADILALSPAGDVLATFIGGNLVYER